MSNRTIKIHADRTFVGPGVPHVHLLYPFWGKNPEPPDDPDRGRFDKYEVAGRSLFEMAPLEAADVAVLPMAWEHVIAREENRRLAEEFLTAAEGARKPSVAFFWSDSDEAVPLSHGRVFRTTLSRHGPRPNELGMPDFSVDLRERYLNGGTPVRKKGDKPVVGFCGFAESRKATLLRRRIRRMATRFSRNRGPVHTAGLPHSGHVTRMETMAYLSKTRAVATHFILRDGFLGGSTVDSSRDRFRSLDRARQEYCRNLVESDYVLCVRGAGSFSYRFCETLSVGRIPLVIYSDRALPCEFAVDWKKYSVWVEEQDLHRVGDIVAEFHAKLSDGDFQDLQHACRKVWEEWLSPEGFFRNVRPHLVQAPGGSVDNGLNNG